MRPLRIRPPYLKIAFFGLPLAAVVLARDGHEIVYAAACRPALGLRRLSTKIAPARTVMRPDLTTGAALAAIRGAAPDLLVSWFWTAKLPPDVLRVAPAVGVHPSLLPRHRGPDPYYWAIESGDEVTGVTAHRLDIEYDTGPVLGRRELAIDPCWNAWQLARALDRPSLALLRDVVHAYAKGEPPAEAPQNEADATQAPEPTDDDLAIRWSLPASRIERLVRAAAPWPGAWTEVGDRLVTLVRVRATLDFPKALQPGEAAVRSDGIAVVRAGEGAIELHEGRSGNDDDTPLFGRELARLVEGARG